MSNIDIAEAFFTAMTVEDDDRIRQLCTPEIAPQQNGGPPLDLDGLLGFAKLTHRTAQGFAYAEPVLVATTNGFVQEHVISGTLADGTAVRVPTCVVGEIIDGRITALREYFDSAAGADLLAALAKQM